MKKKPLSYKDAGVDVDAGDRLVNSIKDIVKSTHNNQVLANIGGFGGLFKPDFSGIEKPVLVSSVDGVGTKLIVAFMAGTYNTVGQDLVNHCVNDIAVCGAEPLFFLDYFSTGKLDEKTAYEVISGFAKACAENGCALIGGETAEMPDMYKEGEFDLAGTIVGVVDQNQVISGQNIAKGDILLGIESTGLHTNGYSLARKVLFSEFEIDFFHNELGCTIGEAMLKVHRSYLSVIRELKRKPGVNGFAHITGGGIAGNTKRILPNGLKLDIDWDSWQRPAIFRLIQELGQVREEDMRQAFNLGIGLVVAISPDAVGPITQRLDQMRENWHIIGKITD